MLVMSEVYGRATTDVSQWHHSERRQLAKIQQQEVERFQYLIMEEKRRRSEGGRCGAALFPEIKKDGERARDCGSRQRIIDMKKDFQKEKLELKSEIVKSKRVRQSAGILQRGDQGVQARNPRLKKQIDSLMNAEVENRPDQADLDETIELSDEEEDEEFLEDEELDLRKKRKRKKRKRKKRKRKKRKKRKRKKRKKRKRKKRKKRRGNRAAHRRRWHLR